MHEAPTSTVEAVTGSPKENTRKQHTSAPFLSEQGETEYFASMLAYPFGKGGLVMFPSLALPVSLDLASTPIEPVHLGSSLLQAFCCRVYFGFKFRQ